MANAIEARKGLFDLWELFSEYPVSLAIIFGLKQFDYLPRERRDLIFTLDSQSASFLKKTRI